MGKRKRNDLEYIQTKIKKLEKKDKWSRSCIYIARLKRHLAAKNDGADSAAFTHAQIPAMVIDTNTEDEPEPDNEPEIDTELETATPENNDEQLPEELLQALGHEGEEKDETTEPIKNELALRWSKIMAEGLKKDQKESLLLKYPQPRNFQSAIAPILNKEISASLSEPSLNRDKRILARQNITGKLMSCLGKSLTDILKGNINSKKLVEEINDAAKIAAEMYHMDTNSRKFFALSSATKAVQDTCKDTKPGKFLFGDNLNEQLKAIETVKRTANQIKLPENNKPSTTKQLNWKSPSQYQPNQRGRGGQHPTRRRPATNQPPRRPPPPSRGASRHAPRRANYRRY